MTQETIEGPLSPADFPQWLSEISAWREQLLANISFNDTFYNDDSLAFFRSSFVQPQVMVHDLYLYDRVNGIYTVDKFVDDTISRYGGIDSILLWHSYPNIGIDNRNQFDMLRSLPGWPDQFRAMVNRFQERGVKVLAPYNPWDVGTRPEGSPDWITIAELWKEANMSGFNGDTMDGIPSDFILASYNVSHPLITQPEVGLDPDCEDLSFDLATWGYWDSPAIPPVSKYKWLARRHMVNICDRWAADHTQNMQFAFFNGVGFESWENVWGIWRGITPRNSEALRRISSIERQFAYILMDSDEWIPHTPVNSSSSEVYCSQFVKGTEQVYTCINVGFVNDTAVLPAIPSGEGYVVADLYHGSLFPSSPSSSGLHASSLSFDIEAQGFGAIYVSQSPGPSDLESFLELMHEMTALPLETFSNTMGYLPQTAVLNGPSPPVTEAPTGMNLIVGTPSFEFFVQGIEIEGDDLPGVDVQYDLFGETVPGRYHNLTIPINDFFLDIYPVTNANYSSYLNESGYVPRDLTNYLNYWSNQNGVWVYPEGADKVPVTWVSLDEARAYCEFYGKRLPQEWEWHYAAQGGDSNRVYPWGNVFNSSNVPVPDTSRTPRMPTPVDAFPGGASPFGIMDMVGNIFQWTNEFVDTRTRRTLIRGGSYYYPQGSGWYFRHGYVLQQHIIYLMMADSLDRAGTLGFRCAVDKL